MAFADLFRDAPPLDVHEADAVLTIAYLTMVADGFEHRAEVETFREIFSRVRALATRAVGQGMYRSTVVRGTARPVSDAELEAVLERLRAETAEKSEIWRDAASKLSEPAGELAYRLALAVRVADLAESQGTERFVAKLGAELGIPPERTRVLERSVLAAMTEPAED
jgi:uncharacterized tellurite resistance protein B-like protein